MHLSYFNGISFHNFNVIVFFFSGRIYRTLSYKILNFNIFINRKMQFVSYSSENFSVHMRKTSKAQTQKAPRDFAVMTCYATLISRQYGLKKLVYQVKSYKNVLSDNFQVQKSRSDTRRENRRVPVDSLLLWDTKLLLADQRLVYPPSLISFVDL